MICSECFWDIVPGEQHAKYVRSGRIAIYVHTIGCEGVFLDKEAAKMKKFNDGMDAIEKQCLNETPEEVDAYLRAAGYDPEALSGRMQKRLRKLLDESPLNPKNQTDGDQPDRPGDGQNGE